MKFSQIFVRVKSSVKPPFFIGSQIRGALGWALKELVCVSDKKCQNCHFQNECLYFKFYEQKNTYHAYRLDFELGLKDYEFSVILFEKETQNAPLIIAALHKMLFEIGLDAAGQRLKFRDVEIFVNDKLCFDGKDLNLPLNFEREFEIWSNLNENSALNSNTLNLSQNLQNLNENSNQNLAKISNLNTLNLTQNSSQISNPQNSLKSCKITLLTPLRIKKDNIFVRKNELEFKDILNSIFQRNLALLGKAREKSPKFSGEISRQNVHFLELTRKSNRQKAVMNLGGLMGEIWLKNLDEKSLAFLKLGELIALGKQCVFGLGKIKVDEI